jgi:hypothetical protein
MESARGKFTAKTRRRQVFFEIAKELPWRNYGFLGVLGALAVR